MENTFLVEIRLGRTKWRIKHLIASITGSSGIEEFMEPHPHVTLFGPLILNNGITPEHLLEVIGTTALPYDPIPFLLAGFEKREGLHGGVIAIVVRPSDPMKVLSVNLAMALLPICQSTNIWDADPNRKWFHVTIANRLNLRKTAAVFAELTRIPGSCVKSGLSPGEPPSWFVHLWELFRSFFPARHREYPPVLLDETGLRITVMHGEEILGEYDLLEKCWIRGDHRHDGSSWQKTLSSYRIKAGFELSTQAHAKTGDIFVIADLHLGHANIIRYCSRPFLFFDVAEMDRVLIGNWNSVVSPGAEVYHVGDLRYGIAAPLARTYREQLKGSVTFITGNHDECEEGAVLSRTIDYDGFRFLLIHDPADAPDEFEGWVIHGHFHNNDLEKYPFISFEHRRINVSAEVVGYVPVCLRDICRDLRYYQGQGRTAPILLRYPYVER